MNRFINLTFLGVTFQYDWMDAPRWAKCLTISKEGVIVLHEKTPVILFKNSTLWGRHDGKTQKVAHIEKWHFEKPMIFGCPENLIVNQ